METGQDGEVVTLILVTSAIASAEVTRLNGLVRVLAVARIGIPAASFAT